ncbi:MAG: hypothetical protein LBV58_04495 [Acholeplasmatales bacterium]|jgi:predicted transcriptional regulator with HTH domain|nr:hypothetical protein [Acholeplasmatales bacterium]
MTDDDTPGPGISPYKSYSEYYNLDYIAFCGPIDKEYMIQSGLYISESDRKYLDLPQGINKKYLDNEDILNLGILDKEQKEDFKNYSVQTGDSSFKMEFYISNDTASENYGKQIIWITNLTRIKNIKVRNELGYALYYESKILDFNYILETAKKKLKLMNLVKYS